ncbi:MAG TPA: helix-turn-helix transcriptional regulator [Streptosporangiaceae bacterium]
MATGGGSTVLRILLGSQLRRLREDRGITPQQAAEHIRASVSKISRMELGRHPFKERDLLDLLTLYEVTDRAELDQLLALARRANEPGWWHGYGDLLPSWFQSYLGLEESAGQIRTYATQWVPGLLQTEAYGAAVIALGGFSAADTERRVAMRTERQRRFREGDLRLWAIIDEAVLRRPVGGREVMRGQLEHLLEAAKRPTLFLQVTPLAVGGNHAAPTGFSILRFPDTEVSDVVYVEHLTGALYLDKPGDVDGYMLAMDRLGVISAGPEDSVEIINSILRDT